jgi:hypothetical protein
MDSKGRKTEQQAWKDSRYEWPGNKTKW